MKKVTRGKLPAASSVKKTAGAAGAIYQVKITLFDSKPPIWRRFLVAGNVPLDTLHEIIQDVMGWTNSHLHEFQLKDGRRFGMKDPDFDFGDDDLLDERKILLSSVAPRAGDLLGYIYDMGDGWEHALKIEKISAGDDRYKDRPICLEGERACPPDDCGGIYGYYDLLDILKDPKHEEYADRLEWLGGEFDSDAFDLKEVNSMLSRYRPRKK